MDRVKESEEKMTVDELIKELRKYPGNMIVLRYNDNGYDYDADYEEIRGVQKHGSYDDSKEIVIY